MKAAGKGHAKESIIYFAACEQSEANNREKTLRELAARLDLSAASVLYDRQDKPPYALLKLADLAESTGYRSTILTDYDWLSAESYNVEGLIYYLEKLGYRFLPKRKPSETDLLLRWISNAKRFCGTDDVEPDRNNIACTAKKSAGRPVYGYRYEEDAIKIDEAKAEIVRKVFRYCAEGLTSSETARNIEQDFPQENSIARSRVPEIILNDRYAGLDETQLGYPVIVSPQVCFAAREKLKSELRYYNNNYEFLFKRLNCSEKGTLRPGLRSGNGREEVYCLPPRQHFIPAVPFDEKATTAICSKLSPHIDSMKKRCIEFAKRRCAESKAKAGKDAELIDELNEKKAERYSTLKGPQTRKELEAFDRINAEIMLARIDLLFMKHLFALTDNAENAVEAYFERLKKLWSLSRREQRFLLNGIVSKVSVEGSNAEIKLPGLGTARFDFD